MDDQKLNVDEILDNEVVVSEDDVENIYVNEEKTLEGKVSEKEHEDNYVFLHNGNAMTERELLSFSARNKVNMVMVAGAYASGKTTLMIMMYYLFREGRNKKLHFKSSYTMNGYWSRGRILTANSGEIEPKTDRTPTEATDLFLNLNLLDESSQQRNMIFADLSGEIFQKQDFLSDILECFLDSKNVWLVLDGQKMGSEDTRREAFHEFIVTLENLIKYGYITQDTKLQIICTKMDCVKEKESEQYIDKKVDFLKKQYKSCVDQIKFSKVSAMQLDDDRECEKLEQIIIDSFEEEYVHSYTDKNLRIRLNRAFDYYGLRK